ncbi:hypothetical protein BDF20DRAFT_910231 [Mycotypha africana]|uniref:uncharacterized protein n=1 Tax=Mycotypha africana TaxID=64632 RepID=UPI0023013B8E|nr:uncharacterized protein BDF20DRAFT_910231 [Mycotypha africana]KAI8987653.1 hypothetical protein BDF20DRAFT_910231 [Mycotypha africana]
MSAINGEVSLEAQLWDDDRSWVEQQPEAKEFTEKDVLPFLLQAQDIISKLESRVVELENDLSTIYGKYEHDRKEWLTGLSQKDDYITHLSSRLSKTEFNSREAITLLGDLLGENHNTLSSTNTEHIQSTIRLCLHYLRMQQTSQYESVLYLNELSEETTTTAITKHNNDHPNQSCDIAEEELLPYSLTASFSTTTASSFQSSSLRHSEEQHMQLSSIYTESSFTLPSSSSMSVPKELEEVVDATTTRSARVNSFSSFCTNCKQLLSQLDAQVEKQAFLKRDLDSLASALNDEEQTRLLIEQDKLELEHDVEVITCSLFTYLNEMLMDEMNNRKELIQLDRDLKGKLFQMVDAWNVRGERLKQMKELLVELDSTVHQSSNLTSCASVRRASFHQRYHQQKRSSFSSTSTAVTQSSLSDSSSNTNRHDSSLAWYSNESNATQTNVIRLDGIMLQEFKDHLNTLCDAKNDLLIPSTPFAKRVFSEDVEPCLFFNSSKQFSQKSWWWGSGWFKRRLLDAILKNECDIQYWTYHRNYSYTQTASESRTSDNPSPLTTSIGNMNALREHDDEVNFKAQQQQQQPPKFKCACCNMLRPCEFRLKLPNIINGNSSSRQQQQIKQQEEYWLPIDRFCRDRVVAVCSYYSFMSHLKFTAFASNAPNIIFLFKQVLHFRRKMAAAKVGSVELFDLDEREEEEKTKRLIIQTEALKRKSSIFVPATNTSSIHKRWTFQQQQRQRGNKHSHISKLTDNSSATSHHNSSTTLVEVVGNQQFIIVK